MEPSTDAAANFMLQEHSRMIDVYQDLHVQKNELVKVYLAFVSIPVSIVAVVLTLYEHVEANPQLKSVLGAVQSAAFYLSLLLVFVGFALLRIMLAIRAEQFLYVKTVNGTRKYFKENHGIGADYLVLPTDPNKFAFAEDERSGRAFWEAMVVNFTTSMLLAFLSWQLDVRIFNWQAPWALSVPFVVFTVSAVWFSLFTKARLKKAIDKLKLVQIG